MGKGPKKSKRKYPAPFSLRLSTQEREDITKLADGQPLGRFIRDAILKHGKRPVPKRTPHIHEIKLLAELLGALGQSRIASNINQLAKAANSGSLPVTEDVAQGLKDALSAIQWMRTCLIKGMGLKPQSDQTEEDNNDPQR